MVIKVAEEVKIFVALHHGSYLRVVRAKMGHGGLQPFHSGIVGLWVERDTFKASAAVVAGETFGMKAGFLGR